MLRRFRLSILSEGETALTWYMENLNPGVSDSQADALNHYFAPPHCHTESFKRLK